MRRPIAALAALSTLFATSARAQTAAFVATLGPDTVAVERWTRTPEALEGEIAFRIAGARVTYHVDYAAGLPVRMHVAMWPLTDTTGTARQRATLRFVGDSVFVDKTPGSPERLGSEPGALPFMNPSFGLFQEIARAAARQNRADPRVPVFVLEGGVTLVAEGTRLGGDSLRITFGGVPMDLRLDADGNILRAVVPAQRLVVTRVDAAAVGWAPAPPPDYSAPPGAPYTAEDVTVPTPEGITLAGTLTLPRGTRGPAPVVLALTGSGPQDRDETLVGLRDYRPFGEIADTLARRGIGMLRLDDRGVGGSQGARADLTMEDFAADARAAIAWLRARAGVDGARLALLGHSEGGVVAPMVAAGDPKLRGIVLLAGTARTGRRVIEYQIRRAADHAFPRDAARADSAYEAGMAGIAAVESRQAWMRHFLAFDPLPTARRVRTPVLVLQGASDRQVTADQAHALGAAFRSGGNRDVTVRVFPGLNHLFLPDPDGSPEGYATLAVRRVPRVALGAIADWLARRLR